MSNCQSLMNIQSLTLFSLLPLEFYLTILSIQIQFYFVLQMYNRKLNFKLVIHSQKNHEKLPVSHIHLELYIVQSIYLLILYYHHYQCRTCYSIYYVEQEIDVQLRSTLPVKSYKIASLS